MLQCRGFAPRRLASRRKPSCRVLDLLEQGLKDIGGDLAIQRMMPLTYTIHEGDAVGSTYYISIVTRTVSNRGGNGGNAILSDRTSSHQMPTSGQPSIAAAVRPQSEWIMVPFCQPRALRQL